MEAIIAVFLVAPFLVAVALYLRWAVNEQRKQTKLRAEVLELEKLRAALMQEAANNLQEAANLRRQRLELVAKRAA